MPITSKVESSNPVYGKVYLIQHYVIKFVSDLQQVGDLLRVPLYICWLYPYDTKSKFINLMYKIN
jgi:hypothetical protein